MMATDSRYDELEDRVREIINDVEGENRVSRYILEQCQRNGAHIAAVRVDFQTMGVRIDRMHGDVVESRTSLNKLNIVIQDIRELRQENAEVNRKLDVILAVLTSGAPPPP
jgi:hypothetical protein